jgi:hypothetical protein
MLSNNILQRGYINAPSGLVSAKFERDTEPTPEEIKILSEEQPKKDFE